jgi:CBS domain containing-hemolysin-like protein
MGMSHFAGSRDELSIQTMPVSWASLMPRQSLIPFKKNKLAAVPVTGIIFLQGMRASISPDGLFIQKQEGSLKMSLLVVYLFTALFLSFLCSILEAMLLSVTPAHAVALKKKGTKTGLRLDRLKRDVDRPLVAMLRLNTITHTVGAAGVGAQEAELFGNASVALASAILTLLILFFSEFIPKTLGPLYLRQLGPVGTHILQWLIWSLYPLVLLCEKITHLLARGYYASVIHREEFQALADLGVEEGVLMELESDILRNLMRFSSLRARDIMTPCSVLFTLPENMSVGKSVNKQSPFSRIPLHPEQGEGIGYYVLRTDVLLAAARGETQKKLLDLAKTILVVPETLFLPRLFDRLLERKQHIAY